MTVTGRSSLRGRAMLTAMKGGFALMRRLRGDLDPDMPQEQAEKIMLTIRAQTESLAGRQRLAGDVTTTDVDLGGVASVRVAAGTVDDSRAVLWLHGGAYIMCSPQTHLGIATAVSRRTGAPVFLPDYRLAPEDPFPAALDDARAAYVALAEDVGSSRIAVGGDSAGGGLAAALLVDLRDREIALPACATLLSPWTDLASTGDSILERDHRDPWLTAALVPVAARAYAGPLELDHPLVSPLYADLAGLPPVLVHVGSEEIVHDDATRYVEHIRAAGGSADLMEFTGMWHVFQAFGRTPETERSWREVGGFIRRHTSGLAVSR